MQSPYRSPQSSTPACSVTIGDRTRFVMPLVCVSCGEPDASLLEYTQDHIPIITPGMGFVRTTHVAVPYCETHARRFQSRFLRLRVAQLLAYLLAGVAGCFLVIPPVREWLQLHQSALIAVYVWLGVAFVFLVVSIFCVKPFLYDVFIVVSGNQIRIQGGVPAFCESLRDVNQGNVADE